MRGEAKGKPRKQMRNPMSAKLDYNATVAARVEITPGLIILRVVPDETLFDFQPGQYTVLGLKRREPRIPDADPDSPATIARDEDFMIRRAYSIASSSLAKEFAEFYITVVRSGELTPRLFHLQVGDRLYMGRKATGIFTIEQVPPHKHLLLIATGTGLAPYISMIRTHLVCGGQRLFVVLHGARYSWDLGYRDELMHLAQLCPNFRYFPSISRPQADPTWSGLTGRLQEIFRSGVVQDQVGLAITPALFDVFLCGNPAMIEDFTLMLEAQGFTKHEGKKQAGTLHVEEYW